MANTYKGNLFALFALIFSSLSIPFAVDFFGRQIFDGFYPRFALSFMAYIIPVILYFFFNKSLGLKDVLSLKMLPLKDILCLCSMGLFIQPLLLIISALSALVSPNNVPAAIQSYSDISFFKIFIIISFLPAVMEEIIFRGIVLSNYKNVSFKKAAVITGIIFGIAHMDLQQFPYAFMMGILFALLVHRSGSILASIIPHMIINAVQSLIGYSAFAIAPSPYITVTAETLGFIFTTPLGMLFSIVIFCIAFLNFNNAHPIKVEEIVTPDRVINLPLIFIIAWYIISTVFI